MKNSFDFYPGMGFATAKRTILRKKKNGEWESWLDVAERVAKGNTLLMPECKTNDGKFELKTKAAKTEFKVLYEHLSKGHLLMSGRHLQHGDETQPTRNLECFSNCSTAPTSFLLFLLLLNGSGVGRLYDDEFMLVNWDNAPTLRCVLSHEHPDFDYSAHESVRDAKHKYGNGKDVLWFTVPDSREGWAEAVEIWENAAFEKVHKDKMLILDFSKVREKGAPIGGMQSRPASGPVPFINALMKCASLKNAGMSKWMQAMYVDHYLAECVLVGGARRSARMAVKYWKDESVLDFINLKRPIEFEGKKPEEILEIRNQGPLNSFLWSANDSVGVDNEFWELLNIKRGDEGYNNPLAQWARKVFKEATKASYFDGTGEPGFINLDKLERKDDGWEDLNRGDYVGSKKYQLREDTQIYMSKLAKKAKKLVHNMIVNPCSEVALIVLGGYCVIGDFVPYQCDTLDEGEDAVRAMVRALIRTNLMDAVYNKETARTNRIGIGITGVHEFAWKFFKYNFYDLIDEEKSKPFWLTLNRFSNAAKDEARRYSEELGVAVPHTVMTVKPAGSVSKLGGYTEGWHLPSMRFYLRWVQFRHDDPLVQTYKDLGYPTRNLVQYDGTTIVGFPTCPLIAEIMPSDKIVCAGDASMEDQYKWVQLGEKYWIDGVVNEDRMGNQISYTLKYKPDDVSYEQFKSMVKEWQPKIKCCSVMPQTELVSYEYQPEEPVTKAKYEQILEKIKKEVEEDISTDSLKCEGGACPVDVRSDEELQEVSSAT